MAALAVAKGREEMKVRGAAGKRLQRRRAISASKRSFGSSGPPELINDLEGVMQVEELDGMK